MDARGEVARILELGKGDIVGAAIFRGSVLQWLKSEWIGGCASVGDDVSSGVVEA